MKKVIAFLIPVLMLASLLSIGASAFSGVNQYEQKLLDYLDNPVTIGEKTYHVSEAHKTRAYNYLNRDDIELTQQEAATAETEMKDLWDKASKLDAKDMSALTDAQKTSMATEMQQVADVLDLTVELDLAKSTITLVDDEGTKVGESTNNIKPTGAASVAAVAVVAVVAVTGCALVLTKKKVHD